MLKRSWKKVLAWVALLGFVILLLSPMLAKAEVTEDDYYNAATLLGKYGLVQGDEGGYRFRDDITRAELAKVLVLAIGLESQVKDFTGRKAFSDTQGHWAEAYIALAKQVGVLRGYPEGDFRPRNPVSYAEVITAFARLVGLEASREPWPFTYVGPASVAGMIPSGMSAVQDLNAAAIRGDVFVLLKRTMVDVKNSKGETLLGRFHDQKPPKLEIDAAPKETSASRIVITGSALEAEQVRVDGNLAPLDFGRFRYPVDLSPGVNVIKVQAFDLAGNKAEQTLEITRVAGSVASIEFTGPARVVAGQAAQYTIVLRNDNGDELADLSGVEATVTGGIGTFDVFSGQFTAGAQVGQGSITLTAGNARRSLNVSIAAGALERIAIQPDNVSLAAGEKQTFMASGTDAQGNAVPLTGLKWTATGGTIDDKGVFTAGQGAAAMSVTATAAGKSGTVTIHQPNYKVARVALTTIATPLVANGKTGPTITATLQDASGATVTDYKGDLTVTSTAPGTAAPVQSTVQVVNGVAVIQVRAGSTAGTATIRATTNLGVSGTSDVKVDKQVLKSIRISVTPSPTSDGSTQGTVELLALDQNDDPIISALPQSVIVKLTITPDTGGVFVLSGTKDTDLAVGPLDGGEVRSRTLVRFNPGSGTLVISGAPRSSAFANVKVLDGTLTAGPVGRPVEVRMEAIPETIAGQERVIYVSVVDANGYRVTSGLTGYNVQLRDQNGVYWTPAAGQDLVGGSGRATFRVTQVKAGNYSYTAHLLPGGHTVSYSTMVVPGPVSAVLLTATPDKLPADNASTSVLKAELVDAYGNRVTSGTFPVTFTKTVNYNATQPMPTPVVVNSVGGVAETTVRSAWLTTLDDDHRETYTASVSGIGSASGPTTVTSQPAYIAVQGVPASLRLTFGDNDGNGAANSPNDYQGTAGRPFTVEARLVDDDGDPVTWENGRQVTLTVRNVVTLQETTYTATTASGVATFVITRSESGTMALKAESTGLVKAISEGYGGAEKDAVLKPGITTAFRVVPDLTRLRTGGSYALVSVQLVDANGNLTINNTSRPITVTLKRPGLSHEYGYFTAEDTVNGEKVDNKTVVIPPGAATSSPVRFFSGSYTGSITLEGTALDGGKHAATITTVSTNGASALRFDSVQAVTWEPVATADTVVTGQTVTLTVLDSAGERVTDYGLSGQTVSVTALGDSRIVAVYNPTLRAWQSLDSTQGNGVGDYPTSYNVPVDRGQAVFRTRAHTPGEKVYKASFGGSDIASTNGRFDSTAPDYLTVQVERRLVSGGGDQVAVQARVRDMYGNTLTWVTGKLKFKVEPATAGTLTAEYADLINGVATVYFQSGLKVIDTAVTVTAESGTLLKADGVTKLAAATDTFNVDGTPGLMGLSASDGATPGAVGEDDVITLTFSENLNMASLPSTGVGSSVSFDVATSTITFQGALAGLGSIHLPSGTITTGNVYSVKNIVVAGSTVTVQLGTASGAPAQVSNAGWHGTASVTMNGTVRDPNGSGAFGPFTIVPTGGF